MIFFGPGQIESSLHPKTSIGNSCEKTVSPNFCHSLVQIRQIKVLPKIALGKKFPNVAVLYGRKLFPL